MPVSVTVSRGNPLPAPIALLLAVVGAALIVLGFTVIPPIPDFGATDGSGVILIVIAALFVIPTWFFFAIYMIKRIATHEDVTIDVPREIPEPPSKLEPSAVSVVVGEGRPTRRAVAGTLLALAEDDKVEINEFGPKVVVDVRRGAAGKTPPERLVLAGLHDVAHGAATIEGPPIWKDRVSWWREFAREARRQATSAGLVEPRIPFIGLMLLMIFTAVGLSLVFFARTAVFVGLILFANGIPHLLARASGFRLTDAGKRARAEWISFGRYLHAQDSVHDVGPAAIAIWGPNLSYGVVLGQAPRVAEMLTPAGDDSEAIDDEIAATETKTYNL
jgi:hypothetical protein